MSHLPSHDTVMPVSYAVSLQLWLQNDTNLGWMRWVACKAQGEESKADASLWALSEGRVGGGGADVPSAMRYLERAPQAQPQHVEHRCSIKASTASSECTTHASIMSSTTALPSVSTRAQAEHAKEQARQNARGVLYAHKHP